MQYRSIFKSMLISVGVLLCSAESFVVEQKPKRTAPDHQVKQEILDLMGRLAELESDSIKTKAEIQKAVCVTIRTYISGDKKSFFSRCSRKDLQQMVTLLRNETASLDKAIVADRRLLESIRNPLPS